MGIIHRLLRAVRPNSRHEPAEPESAPPADHVVGRGRLPGGNSSTEDKAYIVDRSTFGECPRCRDGSKLLQGPTGGICVNCRCESCGKKYNIGIAMDSIILIDDI